MHKRKNEEDSASTATCKLISVLHATKKQMEIAVTRRPTVFTSQMSTLGPVTAIKLLMWITGHTPVMK
jgi:hypothetical protein